MKDTIIVLILCFALICYPIYVFALQRAVLRYYLRKSHSKTYLRKLKKGSSVWARLSGWYYLKGCNQNWLKPALVVMNLNLVSIPIAIVFVVLALCKIISFPLFYKFFAVMFIKDAVLAVILILICKIPD